MKEQFDKRLVSKIKDSFKNHEEPFDPKQWDDFAGAFFTKKKPRSLYLWPLLLGGIAASVLVGFLIWPTVVELDDSDLNAFDIKESTLNQDLPLTDEIADESGITRDESRQEMLAEATPKKPIPIPQGINMNVNEISRSSIVEGPIKDGGEIKKLKLPQLMEQELFLPNLIEEKNLKFPQLAYIEVEYMNEEEAQKIVDKWAMADSPAMVKAKIDKGSRFKLGILMAPQATSNTTMGLNVGGGVMSEISLSKKLKLDVGITYARQSLVPDQSPNMLNALAVNSNAYRNDAASPDAAMLNTSSARANSMMRGNLVAPSYELSFANLDIPINLKYKVMDKPQSGLYLISGISSLVYLNQSTTETYDFSNNAIASADAFSSLQTQVFSTEIQPNDGRSSVDLGTMLNISFGYEYKLTNGTFLAFEPFYKLPIGNMTFIEQQFSIGGVNLRMNFQFKK